MALVVWSVDGKKGSVDLTYARTDSKSVTLASPVAATTVAVWKAPVACTITAVHGYRVGGTAATVNVARNTVNVLAADLSIAGAAAWSDGTPAAPVAVAAGDSVTATVVTATGTPTSVTIQFDYIVTPV